MPVHIFGEPSSMNWLKFSRSYSVLTAAECVLFLLSLKGSKAACQWQGVALILLIIIIIVIWEVS